MSEATIRTSIFNAVSAVAGTGNVYDYQPITTEWDIFLNFFKSGTQIIGWSISNPSTPQEPMTFGGAGSLRDRTYNYTVLGYYSIGSDGASEKTDRIVVENVLNALTNVLTDTDSDINDNQASLVAWEPRDFGGVLCYVAEISLVIESQYTTT